MTPPAPQESATKVNGSATSNGTSSGAGTGSRKRGRDASSEEDKGKDKEALGRKEAGKAKGKEGCGSEAEEQAGSGKNTAARKYKRLRQELVSVLIFFFNLLVLERSVLCWVAQGSLFVRSSVRVAPHNFPKQSIYNLRTTCGRAFGRWSA